MKNLLRAAAASIVLLMMSGSAIYAAPPAHGTVNGNTWTTSLLYFSYSITPVPEMKQLEYDSIVSLTRGSVITVSDTSVEFEIRAITEFDYGAMGEHTIGAPIFNGGTYEFDMPGQYLVYFKEGERYVASFDAEVN